MKTKKRRSRKPSSNATLCRTRGRSNKYQIGTSGFMVSRSQWLALECLNCIEINGTFYRLPTAKVVDNWKQLPDRVSFVIKASKYITHIKRLKDVRDAWEQLWARISPLGRRLRGVLFQLPPSFNYTDVNLRRIVDMQKYIPKSLDVVFEFRNDSWFNTETYKIFRSSKWCVAATYIQKKAGTSWMGTMPGGLNLPPRTASFTYLRIHGARGYKGALSHETLVSLHKTLRKQKGTDTYIMFNNTFFDSRNETCTIEGQKIKYAAICNAVEFTNILPS